VRLRTLRLIIRPFQLADALDYGFVRMGLHKVAAETVTTNVQARQLLERLGFRQEGLLGEHTRLAGEWVDVVWYGLLADQHKPAIGLSTT
jgi:RimJ/RimL family protein N-acetyltransferase